MAGGEDDEASAVNRPGGVKALLKQLNNKFGDSHVKLPDGTVPTPAKKPFTPKVPNRVNREHEQQAPQVQTGGLQPDGSETSPPKGVRAMLQKEVKSSFVKLPDGSTLERAPPPVKVHKPFSAPEQRSSDDDYDPAPVPPDLNLQETEYETDTWEHDDEYESSSAAPPQLLHGMAPQHQRMYRGPHEPERALPQQSPAASGMGGPGSQFSPTVMSDYPVAKENQGVFSMRQASPPALSDYPQTARPAQHGQPYDSGMRKGSRHAGRGQVPGDQGPPQGNRGPGAPSSARLPDRGRQSEANASVDRRFANAERQPQGPPPGRSMVSHHQQQRQSPPQQHKQKEQLGPEDVYNHVNYHNGVPTRERIKREEPLNRDAKSRERDSKKEREVAREREPVFRERERVREREVPSREAAGREPTQRAAMNREGGTGREPMTRDPGIGRDPNAPARGVHGRDGLVRDGPPSQPPAPPALLAGQGPKPPSNGRSGYSAGPMPPNPPNLLPSAKTHDFKVPQVLYTQIRNGCGAEDSPVDGLEKKTNILNGVVLVQRSPPPVAVVRSPRQQEQPTQEAYAQSKVSEWVHSLPTPPLPKSEAISPQHSPQHSHMESMMQKRISPQFESMPSLADQQRTPRDFAEIAMMAPMESGAQTSRSQVSKPQGNRCGIGVNFKRLDSGCMEVVGLVPGGMGAESGLIFVGDVLRFVDGVDVTKTNGPDFDDILLGEDGSTVTLSFGKPGSNTSALVHVAVNRGLGPMSRESSLSSMPTAVGNASNYITPLPVSVTPAKVASAVPRVLVPKVIHANPVNVQQMKSNRPDSAVRSDSSLSPNRDTHGKMVGVGIVFNVDEMGALRVKNLIQGGPAAMSNEIMPGDVLCQIDGLDVYRKSVDEIQDVVMGPKDSVVTLGLMHPANPGQVRQVHLFRRFDASIVEVPPAPASTESYSKVIEMLYLGDSEISRNIGLMKDLGINCVVNVALECDNLFEADFTYSNFPFEDHPSSLLTSGFDDACEVIARNMHLALTSIVHCSDGNNRGAALCVAYLMRKKRATLKQAWNLVKNVRPSVNLYQSFFQQLLQYERQVHGTNTMLESDITFADGDTVV